MYVHLYPAQWLVVLAALGEELPQVQARIRESCNAAGDEPVVAVEGRAEGWRAVCDRLNQRETEDIGRVVRLMVTAAEAEW
jgi:hypothetical protein